MDDSEYKNPFISDKTARISKLAVELLGYPDRMLYRSKGSGKPTTIFNANIYDSKAEKIWYGDLEIEKDRQALIDLSNRLGAIYVLWERDGRFLDLSPTIEYVKSRAIVVIENGSVIYSREFADRVNQLTIRQGGKSK